MFRSILFPVLLLVSPLALAATPTQELTADTAVKLINMRSASLPTGERPMAADIRVALIHEGSAPSDGLRMTHVRRVISIEGVLEQGSKVRRRVCREFHWNEESGWHLWEARMERGGEAVWIWSETQGQVIVR